MVQLATLLPILLEGESSSSQGNDDDDQDGHAAGLLLSVGALIEELANVGIHSDTDLLFASSKISVSPQAARTLETLAVKDKIADFLAAEGTPANELYLREVPSVDPSREHDKSDSFLSATGVQAIDKLLGGGWRGEVVEVVGEHGTGKTFLALHTVLKRLHENPNEHALWLDTTGSFSAEWGSRVLEAIQQQSTSMPVDPVTQSDSTSAAAVEQPVEDFNPSANGALDRLIVARTLDLQSAIQTIHQVRQQIAGQAKSSSPKPEKEEEKLDTREQETLEEMEHTNVVPETGEPVNWTLESSPPEMAKQAMVDQEMSVDDSAAKEESVKPDVESHVNDSLPQEHTSKPAPQLRFIVIDSISALLKGVLSATSAEGHARMMSFMRLLRLLAHGPHHHGSSDNIGMTIFVINNLVSLASNANSTSALTSVFPALNAKKVKPGLGPTFTYLTDWTVYLSHASEALPTSSHVASAHTENDETRKRIIFEIARSRRMPQARWALMTVDNNTYLR